MITDQATALRTMMSERQETAARPSSAAAIDRDPHHDARTTRRARVIAITSGKGGVGKTNIAVCLAVRLSMMGRRVILLDADLGTANADVICNITPTINLAHVVAGRAPLTKAMVNAPGGFRLIPGASGLAQIAALSAFERERVIQQLRQIETSADIVLIDTGAGVGPNVLSFAVSADQLLVVTTPEPTAVTDAYAVIKTVSRQRENPEIRVLVNMVQNPIEARDVFNRLDAVCRRFLKLTLRYGGHIPSDPRVGQAVRKRTPFVLEAPQSEASVCVGELAHRLDRHAVEPTGEGLLRRMATWLSR